MPRFVQVLRGRHAAGTGAARSYGAPGGAYAATAERTRDRDRACRCGTGRACALHGASTSKVEPAYDTDEERLYIHKTVSVELARRDACA